MVVCDAKCDHCINGECEVELIAINSEGKCKDFLPCREILIKELDESKQEIKRLQEQIAMMKIRPTAPVVPPVVPPMIAPPRPRPNTMLPVELPCDGIPGM